MRNLLVRTKSYYLILRIVKCFKNNVISYFPFGLEYSLYKNESTKYGLTIDLKLSIDLALMDNLHLSPCLCILVCKFNLLSKAFLTLNVNHPPPSSRVAALKNFVCVN